MQLFEFLKGTKKIIRINFCIYCKFIKYHLIIFYYPINYFNKIHNFHDGKNGQIYGYRDQWNDIVVIIAGIMLVLGPCGVHIIGPDKKSARKLEAQQRGTVEDGKDRDVQRQNGEKCLKILNYFIFIIFIIYVEYQPTNNNLWGSSQIWIKNYSNGLDQNGSVFGRKSPNDFFSQFFK